MYRRHLFPELSCIGRHSLAAAERCCAAGPHRRCPASQIVLGLTAVAAGAYGLQRLVAPYAREYYERWALSVAARKAAADGAPAADGGAAAAGKLTAKEQATATALADAIKVCAVGRGRSRLLQKGRCSVDLTASRQRDWSASRGHLAIDQRAGSRSCLGVHPAHSCGGHGFAADPAAIHSIAHRRTDRL